MNKYNKEIINILKCSEKEAYLMNHSYIGTEHVILSILALNCSLKYVLNGYNVYYDNYKEELIRKTYKGNKYNMIYTPLLKRIINNSNNNINNILLEIIEEGEGIGLSILNSLNVDISSLYKSIKNNNKEMYGINLNELAKKNSLNKVIGREKEINEIIEILCRKNKCNPLLIGDAGVGKTAIIEGLAHKIINKDVPDSLINKNIISISMSSIVSGTKYRGEFEEKLEKIISNFSNDNNKILFIDEIHTMVGAGGAEGAIDASNILKPYLARNSIKCIGSTTKEEYNKYIKKDKALDRRFNIVEIKEPSEKELKFILYGIKNEYENYHKIKISNKEIDYIIQLSKKNNCKKEPDKSIDLLDYICTKASIDLKNKRKIYYDNLYNRILNNKIKYLENKDYFNAYLYKEKENIINKKRFSYKPKVTVNYINKIVNNCVEKSYIGF